MHELAIAQSMVDILFEQAKQHNSNKIMKVGIVVGKISGVMPHALQFCFESLTDGTIAEGAALDIEEVPCRGKCTDCGETFEIAEYYFFCPKCKSLNIEIKGGKELYVSEMEME